QAVGRGEPAGALGEPRHAADGPRAPDELLNGEVALRGGAQRELRRRALCGEAGPRDDRVARVALILMEAAHVPAVVELDDAPLVPVAGGAPVLMHGEIIRCPLAIDPSHATLDVLGIVTPCQATAHVEAALEVRVGSRSTEEHHLPAQEAATERGGRPRGVDRELEAHAGAVMIDTGQDHVPRERHEVAVAITSLLPARRARSGLEAKRQLSWRR